MISDQSSHLMSLSEVGWGPHSMSGFVFRVGYRTAVQRHFYIENLIRHKFSTQPEKKIIKLKNKRKCSVKKKKKVVSCSKLTELTLGGGGGWDPFPRPPNRWPQGQTVGCRFVLRDQKRTGLLSEGLHSKSEHIFYRLTQIFPSRLILKQINDIIKYFLKISVHSL